MAAARRRIRVPLSQLTPELRDALRVLDIDVAEGESTHEEMVALVKEIQAERGAIEEDRARLERDWDHTWKRRSQSNGLPGW